MARKEKTGRTYETTSPFETKAPPRSDSTFPVEPDPSPIFPKKGPYTGPQVRADIDADRYDNPSGYPGLKMVSFGSDRPKLDGKR